MKNTRTMEMLQAVAMMSGGLLPHLIIKKPSKTYSGQGSRERQRRLRQQQRNKS